MIAQHSKRVCLLLGWIVGFSSSSVLADSAPAEGVAFFETHIRPLLASRCYECHAERTGKREGGLVLDSRPGWMAGGDRGPVIIAGDAEGSLLMQAVRYVDPNLQMPPDQALAAKSVERIRQWIAMGAPDPRDSVDGARQRLSKPSDPVAGREHWAFRPLVRSHPPSVQTSPWPRTSIDCYVLARLEANRLQPAPDADRLTLLRRLSTVLTGLPPTPALMTEFLHDSRPDAYERWVDRLLESPHFGERWGRHWMDLARYADSNGLDENFLFREAWRYRNWVIDAVNEDVSFDRFAMEQIAGDLLPFESTEQRDRQRIAAGFMVIGPKVLLGNDSKNQRMEIADEQLDTIGRALLGQTLGCARCHDHKFDPIPTADYYAMAGILTSTKVMEQRYMLGQQRFMERLVGLGADGETADSRYEEYWRGRPQLVEKQKQARMALELLTKNDASAFAEFAAKHPHAIATELTDQAAFEAMTAQQRSAAQQALVASLDAEVEKPPVIPPRAMIPCDGDSPGDEHIRLAGQFDRLGRQVPRGWLQVISDVAPDIPAGQSGRLQLAHWLTDVDQGAGRLTARVWANRIWYHIMGRGIVRTVDNFGRTGEAPSHPLLLDYLASELIASGWSLKSVVRQIVLSRTFLQGSAHRDGAHAVDPENRLLWRAHRRRLDPESLRDAMLAASGQLDLTPMESSVWYLGDQATAVGDNKNRRRTDFACRSVYLPVIRNDLPELFGVFDFADPHATTGLRPQTLVATQGLFMLNDPLVSDAAERLAQQLIDNPECNEPHVRVDAMLSCVLCAHPTDKQRRQMLEFVRDTEQLLELGGEENVELRTWALACQALFASSRFQVLE